MPETVVVTMKSFQRVFTYSWKESNGEFVQRNKTSAKKEKSKLYPVLDLITITTADMRQAVDRRV